MTLFPHRRVPSHPNTSLISHRPVPSQLSRFSPINDHTVEKAPSKTTPSTTMVDATLPENPLSMLDSGHGADVTILVGGAKIPAHRAILSARSDYFRRMFNTEMQEAASGVVDVKDVDADIFRRLLRFIYGGVLS